MKLIKYRPIARFARPPVRPRGDSCVHRIVRWSPGTAAPLRLSYPRYAHMLTHPRRAARLAPFLRAAWRNDKVGRLLPKWAAVLNAGLRRKHRSRGPPRTPFTAARRVQRMELSKPASSPRAAPEECCLAPHSLPASIASPGPARSVAAARFAPHSLPA
jgi:hypothetical protein